jgi:lysophospholipase L1-like esterase
MANVAKTGRRTSIGLAAVAAAALLLPATSGAQPASPWVGAWGFAPGPLQPGTPNTPPANPTIPLAAPPAAPAPAGPPPAPLLENPGGLPIDFAASGDIANLTIRQVVRVSVAGSQVRLRFSNEAGVIPIVLGAVRVGLAGPDGVTTNSRIVTFDGAAGVAIPAGAPLLSDPVDLPVKALDRLYVSTFLPTATPRGPRQVFQYVAGQGGDFSGSAGLPGAKLMRAPALVTGVEVAASRPTNVVVTLGDSITEGAASTANAFRSWPDRLAERLAGANANWSVVNVGYSGNRLLRYGAGPSALARLDRDVLSVPGVKALIVLEGINDIGRGFNPANGEPITAKALIAAQKQIIARAHARGIRVIGATLTPYKGAAYATEAGEAVRQEYNTWIRTSGAFDAVIDFAKPVASAADPLTFDTRYNDRDKLHPNDAGYKAMADFVDLAVITGR